MTDTLLEAIREVLMLDSKRTQGEWSTEKFNRDPVISSYNPVNLMTPKRAIRIGNDVSADGDADFIAAAPMMASLLRQCMERMEADGAVLKAAIMIRDDLLLRAEEYDQKPARKVVACGNGAWIGLNHAIDSAILNNREQKA